MKSSKRIYGVPFFKITIPFLNNSEECIGVICIRAKTEAPIKIGAFHGFEDIDGHLHECTQWKFHGPANEEEQNAPYC